MLGAAMAQESDCNPLCQELSKAGFEILDLGEAYGVPYVEIKVPVGASVTTICRKVPA